MIFDLGRTSSFTNRPTFHVEIEILRLLWKMFLGTLPCPARRAFISRFFSQNRSFTMRTLFLTSKAKNRFFKKNVFLTPNVCSFDPSGGGGGYFTPPMPPTITRPTLNTRNESFMFPIENVLLTLRTDNQADNFFSKTLLYEKENKHLRPLFAISNSDLYDHSDSYA